MGEAELDVELLWVGYQAPSFTVATTAGRW